MGQRATRAPKGLSRRPTRSARANCANALGRATRKVTRPVPSKASNPTPDVRLPPRSTVAFAGLFGGCRLWHPLAIPTRLKTAGRRRIGRFGEDTLGPACRHWQPVLSQVLAKRTQSSSSGGDPGDSQFSPLNGTRRAAAAAARPIRVGPLTLLREVGQRLGEALHVDGELGVRAVDRPDRDLGRRRGAQALDHVSSSGSSASQWSGTQIE